VSLKVNEIFYSIQGESSFAGKPCVFIRLTGCNLRCSYCDTKYAYDEGNMMSLDGILAHVKEYNCPLVEVTGGEPLLQNETPLLVNRLLDGEYEVLLETNGTIDISVIDDRCVRIMDIKCPSSSEAEQNDLDNLKRLTNRDELKFIIGDKHDYEFTKEILSSLTQKLSTKIKIHLSPSFGRLDPRELAEWILNDNLNVRLQLQLHKYIWPPDQRGV
jgi:7-carboxy-7-deazaguanine synthase